MKMTGSVCLSVVVLVIGCFDQGLFSKVGKRAVEENCCPSPNGMSIDLTQGTVSGSVAGVSTPIFYPQTNTESKCSYMAELTANFQSLTRCLYDWHHGGCVNFPMCGRRMLRIDMFLGDVRNGFMFNVGDSPSNNGWGGDSGHTQNDAEIFGRYPTMYSYKSDLCKSENTAWANTLLAPDVKRVTIFVANNFFRITNDQGFDVEDCHKCLFALNGQDPNDPANTLYMAFNKVIQKFSSRRGVGVCNVRIRWECPDCERSSILTTSLDVKSADWK
ncbi:uncharacterized protein LOC111130504 [Crassostrea virginica]